MRSRLVRVLTLGLLSAVAAIGFAPGAAHADTYVPVSEDGSSWAYNAIDAWRAAVAQQFRVGTGSNGSVTGLQSFANNTIDFAGSDIPYGLPNGTSPSLPGRKFVYVPDVAGGTALMYNLSVGGQMYTNLKLSQSTIAGIFAGTIKVWNDPAIKKDNPAVATQLPSLKITPVVRADGSGSTALFTQWLSYPGSPWRCGETSAFTGCSQYSPTVQQAKKGDDGIAGYVQQPIDAGSIGYVQYSYAVKSGMPAAKVLNKGGYYVLPTPSNAAVALTAAKINTADPNSSDYLTQDLTGVYADKDPRAYPISSYSYFVLPTDGFPSDKGKSVSYFANYALCHGQATAMDLGYSPLPRNLVLAGLSLLKNIPGAVPVDLSLKSCGGKDNNPALSPSGANLLATSALYPDKCDAAGAPASCTYGTASNGGKSGSTAGQGDNNTSHAGNGAGGSTGTTGGVGTVGTTGTTGTTGATGTTVGSNGVPSVGGAGLPAGGSGTGSNAISLTNPDGKTVCDPDTGQCTKLSASPVDVPSSAGSTMARVAMYLMAAALLALMLAPPVIVLSRWKAAR